MSLDYNAMEQDGIKPSDFEAAVREGDDRFIVYAANAWDFDMNQFPDGGHPLSVACEAGFLDAAKALVEWGADIHYKPDECPTPLIIAARNGHSHIVSWLVENGVDINYEHEEIDGSGDWEWSGTALTVAIRQGHFDIVEYLMDRGASLNVTMISTSTNPHGLPETEVETSCPIFEFAEEKSLYLYHKAVRLGALKLLPDTERHVLLGRLLKTGKIEAMEPLFHHFPELLNQEVESGKYGTVTPLEMAALQKDEELLSFLLESGADLNRRNVDGVLMFASLADIWPEKSNELITALAKQQDKVDDSWKSNDLPTDTDENP